MKVAILNSYLFPIPAIRGGAVETLIESIVKGANEDKSIEITSFSLYDKNAMSMSIEKYPNVRFRWLRRPDYIDFIDKRITSFIRFIKRDKDLWQKNYLWQILNAKKTKKFLLEQDYDVVIIQNALYLCDIFATKELENKYRGKVYFHTHNIHFRKVNLSSAFAGIISISHYLEENIRKCFGNNIPIHVVHNGVDTKKFELTISNFEQEELKLRYNIPKDSPVILFVGRIMPKKGVWELLQAFQQLENSSAHLILVGASSFGMDNLTSFEKDVARVVANSSKVHATGFVPNKDLGKYYKLADVVVLPSIWEEPLGLTMIEAQLSGTPLITTNKGGIPETTSSDNSVIVDVTNNLPRDLARAIDEVLKNPTIWNEKAKNAQYTTQNRFNEKVFYQNIKDAINIASK